MPRFDDTFLDELFQPFPYFSFLKRRYFSGCFLDVLEFREVLQGETRERVCTLRIVNSPFLHSVFIVEVFDDVVCRRLDQRTFSQFEQGEPLSSLRQKEDHTKIIFQPLPALVCYRKYIL